MDIFDSFFNFPLFGTVHTIAHHAIGEEYEVKTERIDSKFYNTYVRKNKGIWIATHQAFNERSAKAAHVSWCAACTLHPTKVYDTIREIYREL